MDSIFEHYKKTGYLHHAYVIEGYHDEIAPALILSIEKHLGITAKGNPDFAIVRYDSFSIDEARMLKDVQTRAAWGGEHKIFVISAASFTHEAQNALLKTFEEPTAGTHFFIIVPRAEILLPTLRSRVLVIGSSSAHGDDESKALAEKLLSATLENRFALIKKLVEKKDKELFRRILGDIEQVLYARTKGKRTEMSSNVFEEIHKAKTYLATRGASPKMILEHIMMVV